MKYAHLRSQMIDLLVEAIGIHGWCVASDSFSYFENTWDDSGETSLSHIIALLVNSSEYPWSLYIAGDLLYPMLDDAPSSVWEEIEAEWATSKQTAAHISVRLLEGLEFKHGDEFVSLLDFLPDIKRHLKTFNKDTKILLRVLPGAKSPEFTRQRNNLICALSFIRETD